LAAFRLIAGLGNPSRQYEHSRHNAGFWFLDKLAERHSLTFVRERGRFHGDVAYLDWDGRTIILLKPTTFMNHSGRSVGAVARYFRIAPETVLVAHDDLDFAPGVIRFKRSGGHGGHNGLKDVIVGIGSRDFSRLRIGIGRPLDARSVVDFVLGEPSVEEKRAVSVALNRAVDSFPALLEGRFEAFMNSAHAS
jgi:PTH1 family peptidyl-tRNA hydrolase